MALRTRCPKCETDVREGTRRCPICATPLSVDALEPRIPEEGDPLIDPLLDLFDRDEPVRTCPSCWNEFLSALKRCSACDCMLRVIPRSKFEAALRHRPVVDRGTRVMKGPEDTPRDLMRVHTCVDPSEAQKWVKEFRFMGAKLWVGTDTLDVDKDTSRIGLYVRPADFETARYLFGAQRASEPDPFGPKDSRDARRRRLDDARLYLEFRKYKQVIAILDVTSGDPEADDLLGDALVFAGRVREAERRASAGAEASPQGPSRGKLLFSAGVFAALGNDGTPHGDGSRLLVARDRLVRATAEAPRLLDAGKALVEVLTFLRDEPAALAELRRMTRLNPNVLAIDGWFRATHETLRARHL